MVKDSIPLEQQKIHNNSKIAVMISQQKVIKPQETTQINLDIPQQKPQQQVQQPKPQQIPSSMQLLQNQNQMQQLQQDPAIQSLMKNKEFMRYQLKNNPMMKKLIEQHPEIADQMTDENLDEMIDTLNDPVKMDELIQQSNKALENIQNQPGGQEVLQKLQSDLLDQEDFEESLKILKNQKTNQNSWLPQEQQDTKPQISQPQEQNQQYSYNDYNDFPASYCSGLINSLEKSKYTQQNQPQQETQQQNNQQNNQDYIPFNGNFDDLDQLYQQQMQNQGQPTFQQMQQAIDQLKQDPQSLDYMLQIAQNPQMFYQLCETPDIKQQMQMLGINDPEQFRQVYIQQIYQMKELLQNGSLDGLNQYNNQYNNNQQAQYNEYGQMTQESIDNLKQKYALQLQQIKDMGINAPDEEILQLLEACGGSVELVVNQLFS